MTISTEQFIAVNVGASANDGTGDSLRDAFIKLNNNFANISDIGFDAGNISVQGGAEVAGNVVAGNVYADTYFLSDGSLPLDDYPFAAKFSSNVVIAGTYVPTANTSPGVAGQIAWNSGYIYVCVATNTWKRAAISTW